MNVNLLAISVGNTRIQLGTFVDGKLHERQFLTNNSLAALGVVLDEAFKPLRDLEDSQVVLASVNPVLTDDIFKTIAQQFGKPPRRIEHDLKAPIGRQLDPESIIGEDRLLNAAAAYDRLKKACVVVDAGTAITVDFVDGAGTFHGGAIAPGARMMLHAMHKGTAQLPAVEWARPREPVGHSTAEAMRCGVFYGLRGVVRELSEMYAQVAGNYPAVIATGGDAELLFEGYDLVERIVPELTLLGIAAAVRYEKIAEEEA